MVSLQRFLNPKSIAVFGGAWASNVIEQLVKSGYQGEIWPVHPERDEICGINTFANIAQLPGSPDAAFIGVNRQATVNIVAALKARNAGGAICFASGFNESQGTGDDPDQNLQVLLLEAAGDMPILGPNCYGYLNYLDNVCIWPDQHGGRSVSEGVAIIAQSSNIAINMTMQRRGLALSHMLTVGNQAQIGVSELAMTVLSDSRVHAIGFYLESFGDIRAFEKMANHARVLKKPLVVLKIGKSAKAQIASMTHTASLTGNAVVSSAFLQRLGIVEVNSIAVLLETLKLLHQFGPLQDCTIASMSCSGGEASLMSDMASDTSIVYPDLTANQQSELNAILGSKVELANPLDYHTYVWGNVPAMTASFSAVLKGGCALNVLVLDLPRSDRCEVVGHDCAIESIIAAKQGSCANVAVLAVLPENIEESVNQQLVDNGIVPLHGMSDAIAAIDAAIRSGKLLSEAVDCLPLVFAPVDVKAVECGTTIEGCCMDEATAKIALRECGVSVPAMRHALDKSAVLEAASDLGFPLVLKGMGVSHKTEANVVVLGIQTKEELSLAIEKMADCLEGYLLEEMIDDVIAEMLIGVIVDDSGLMLLTIGAGGVLAELMDDTRSICLPASRGQISDAIDTLKITRLLAGYRGSSLANQEVMLDAIELIAQFAIDHRETLIELDINPLMVGQQNTVVADALVRLR